MFSSGLHKVNKKHLFWEMFSKGRAYCLSHESNTIGFIKIFQRAVKWESRSMPSPWLQDEQVGDTWWRHGGTFELLGSKSIKVCKVSAQGTWTLDWSERWVFWECWETWHDPSYLISVQCHILRTCPDQDAGNVQLPACQTPGSGAGGELSVHPRPVWAVQRLPSLPGHRGSVHMCLELRLHSPGGVSVRVRNWVKPQRGTGEFLLGGPELHAHSRWRGVVLHVRPGVRPGPLHLQEETPGKHQANSLRCDYTPNGVKLNDMWCF